jgi:uncharacterized protein YaaR (DUF327 family)
VVIKDLVVIKESVVIKEFVKGVRDSLYSWSKNRSMSSASDRAALLSATVRR